MTAAEPGDVAGRSNSVSRPAATRAEPVSASVARAADAAVTAMYAAHYRSLVGLAVLLVRDGNADTAQRVVQDSFVALHRNWRGLAGRDGSADGSADRDCGGDRALLYLWQRVLNRSRSAGRQPASRATQGSADGPAPVAVLAAIRTLPRRQREALVLQHYAGLSTAQTAQMLGISADAVQRHAARAMSSLHGILETEL
jgi:DNA-directed RNA polymerase specialized sigma24 family protein